MNKFHLPKAIRSPLSLMLIMGILLSCCATIESPCHNDVASAFACRQTVTYDNTVHDDVADTINMAGVSRLQQTNLTQQCYGDKVEGSIVERHCNSNKVKNSIKPMSSGRTCVYKVRAADGGILRHHQE